MRSSILRSVVACLLTTSPATVALAGETPAATTAEQQQLAGDLDGALAAFAERLERDPSDHAAMIGRVRGLLKSDRWPEALAEAQGYAAAAPDEAELAVAHAEALFRAGRLESIEPLLTPIVGRPDAPARAHVTMGRLRRAEGRFADAVEHMQRAVDSAPDDRYVMYWSSDATSSRAIAIDRLERYLAQSEGDDPDRIEAAQGSVRLFRALGEQVIWADENRPERIEVPLRPVWHHGTTRITGYVIEVAVGERGKKVKLLLDTGSPGLFVVERIAKKRGFRELSVQTTFGGGGDRRHTTRRGFFDSLAIGDLRFRSVLATTSKDEIDPLGRFHGLLGLSAFNGYQVTLDLKRKKLIAVRVPEQAPAGARYWVIGGQWLVRAAEVGDGADGLFLFDTGATRTLLASRFVDGLQQAAISEAAEIQGFGGALSGARTVDGIVVEFLGHRVGPHDLRVVDVSLRSKMGGVEVSGMLGLDLLGASRITIDTVHRVIGLTARSP